VRIRTVRRELCVIDCSGVAFGAQPGDRVASVLRASADALLFVIPAGIAREQLHHTAVILQGALDAMLRSTPVATVPVLIAVTGVDAGGAAIALKEVKAALPLQHDMVACMGIMYVSGVTGRGVASGLRWLEAAADAMQEAADEGAASHRQTAPPSL
jgi:hypothetical protein